MVLNKFRNLHILLLLIFIFGVCSSHIINCTREEQTDEIYTETDRSGVILQDRSTLRLDPILYSATIDYIRLGEVVELLGQSKEKSWIGDTNDYWYKIKLKGGPVGWTYGTNIKVFAGKDRDDIDDFLVTFWEQEKKKLQKTLSGRWWSVDQWDHYTNHCIELYNNGKYKAFCVNCTPIEGEYKINFDDYEIILLKGSYIGDRVNYMTRDTVYILKKPEPNEIKFKRVRKKIEDVQAELDKKIKDDEKDKNK